ncbi:MULTISPECIES: helix-turn-helix transcriptional regulator [Streptomyces]|uniref:helix-turn-helix transcriptional regulator n=1 Tax=Streptomyces TaxID=1883 RepID=UPI000C38318C|nr:MULTISPECIES: helix-turn-helix transcriptional regulator [Streptomyces]PIB03822.1 transcriptional regulator [Streptomyces sp. HG99]
MTNGGELAAFLRSRREQLKPEQVGLPSYGRRRTPGLRREELATLAGLSIEYLERLEQGRDTNPSVAVLAALAEALRLSDDEKRHLAILAMKRHSAALFPAPRPVSDEVRPTVRALLDHLDPTPACLLGPIYNVVAWNSACEAVIRPMGVLDEDSPNFIRYHFLNPTARQVFADRAWAATADEVVGWLRSAQPDWGFDDEFRTLVDDLGAVPEFASRWAAHPVAFRQPGGSRLSHPDAGILNLSREVLLVGEANHWLQLWLPRDEKTTSAIKALLSAPPPLRIVQS